MVYEKHIYNKLIQDWKSNLGTYAVKTQFNRHVMRHLDCLRTGISMQNAITIKHLLENPKIDMDSSK